MVARVARTFGSRLVAALAIAGALLGISTVGQGTPVLAAGLDNQNRATRALELQGYLAGAGDEHYLGLELDPGAQAIVLTLLYRAPATALVQDGVGFSVLAADGLPAYFSGATLEQVATVQGKVFSSGPDGTIVQATLRPGDARSDDGFTVVVYNSWYDSISYGLTVHGGTLVDEGGQTLLLAPAAPAPPQQPVLAKPESVQVAAVAGVDTPAGEVTVPAAQAAMPAPAQDSGSATIPAVFSGAAQPYGARHFYELRPSGPDGEVSVRLHYDAAVGAVPDGAISFWVLTMDGLHHVVQGALLDELYLASGQPAAAGELAATVRLGGEDTYALAVFNQSGSIANFRLAVHGAELAIADGFSGLELDGNPGRPELRPLAPTGGTMALIQP